MWFFIGNLGRSLLLTAVVAIGAVCLMGCGDKTHPSELLGHWVRVDGAIIGKPRAIELFKDGTGVLDNGSISWKVDGKRLVLLSTGGGLACNYEVDDPGMLTLVYDDKKFAEFVKRDKLEVYQSQKRGMIEYVLSSYFTDMRDNQKYRAIRIGEKVTTWMAENLRYQPKTGKSWCYGNDKTKCDVLGRLYDWNTAKTVCPSGWHLPSIEDWDYLVTVVGGVGVAGLTLRTTADWRIDGGWSSEKDSSGTDSFGFSALPTGMIDKNFSFDKFRGLGSWGGWWSAAAVNDKMAFYIGIVAGKEEVSVDGWNKNSGFSVRCVKDE